MLLELDSDQRLWRDTARDAAAKECPASLVRGVAEGDVLAHGSFGVTAAKLPNVLGEDTWDLSKVLLR